MAESDPSPPSGRPQPSQQFLAGGALLCLMAALVLLLQPQPELLAVHRGMAGLAAAVGLVFAWLSRRRVPLAMEDRVLVASMLAIVLVVALAWLLGTGLRTVALGILPLLVGLATLLCGRRRALVVMVAAVGGITLLALRDHAVGRQAIVAAWSLLTEASGVSSHVVLLLAGLVCGLVARNLVQRWQALADERERQFRELLATAADRYIELDAELRFAAPSVVVPDGSPPLPPGFIGCHPWDAPGLHFAPGQAEANRATLQARQPFTLQVMSDPVPGRPPEHLAISGRPRYSDSGEFLGYWCVGRDITAQVQQRQAAERAAAEAEAASRAKSAFLANMSHEIRTPLNGILGLAQLARGHVDDRARLVEYLDLIGSSATALHATLSNVLDLSRLESGRLELVNQAFDLSALLHELHHGFAALARARGLACVLTLDPGLPPHVQGDAVRLRQILTNYLHNALKFTERGNIGLVARVLAPGRLRFEVHDTGPGLSDAAQAQLFKPFAQLDAAPTRRRDGSGLGLSICLELASAMGGAVGVSSQPGQGSRFWLELPLPPCSPADTPVPEPLPSLAGLHVLVAEDNPVNMMISVALLEGMGAQVEQVSDGRAAVAAVRAAHERPFDVVLMDLQMPELDGVAATRAIRAQGLPVRIVALTAAMPGDDRAALAAAGFDEVIGKPVDAEHLQRVLARLARA